MEMNESDYRKNRPHASSNVQSQSVIRFPGVKHPLLTSGDVIRWLYNRVLVSYKNLSWFWSVLFIILTLDTVLYLRVVTDSTSYDINHIRQVRSIPPSITGKCRPGYDITAEGVRSLHTSYDILSTLASNVAFRLLTGYSVFQCSPCREGHSKNISQNRCTPCSPGHYQDEKGSSSCKPCIPGSYQTNSGASRCTPCPPNEYQPDAGKVTCLPCGKGEYQLQYHSVSCLPCTTKCDNNTPPACRNRCEEDQGFLGGFLFDFDRTLRILTEPSTQPEPPIAKDEELPQESPEQTNNQDNKIIENEFLSDTSNDTTTGIKLLHDLNEKVDNQVSVEDDADQPESNPEAQLIPELPSMKSSEDVRSSNDNELLLTEDKILSTEDNKPLSEGTIELRQPKNSLSSYKPSKKGKKRLRYSRHRHPILKEIAKRINQGLHHFSANPPVVSLPAENPPGLKIQTPKLDFTYSQIEDLSPGGIEIADRTLSESQSSAGSSMEQEKNVLGITESVSNPAIIAVNDKNSEVNRHRVGPIIGEDTILNSMNPEPPSSEPQHAVTKPPIQDILTCTVGSILEYAEKEPETTIVALLYDRKVLLQDVLVMAEEEFSSFINQLLRVKERELPLVALPLALAIVFNYVIAVTLLIRSIVGVSNSPSHTYLLLLLDINVMIVTSFFGDPNSRSGYFLITFLLYVTLLQSLLVFYLDCIAKSRVSPRDHDDDTCDVSVSCVVGHVVRAVLLALLPVVIAGFMVANKPLITSKFISLSDDTYSLQIIFTLRVLILPGSLTVTESLIKSSHPMAFPMLQMFLELLKFGILSYAFIIGGSSFINIMISLALNVALTSLGVVLWDVLYCADIIYAKRSRGIVTEDDVTMVTEVKKRRHATSDFVRYIEHDVVTYDNNLYDRSSAEEDSTSSVEIVEKTGLLFERSRSPQKNDVIIYRNASPVQEKVEFTSTSECKLYLVRMTGSSDSLEDTLLPTLKEEEEEGLARRETRDGDLEEEEDEDTLIEGEDNDGDDDDGFILIPQIVVNNMHQNRQECLCVEEEETERRRCHSAGDVENSNLDGKVEPESSFMGEVEVNPDRRCRSSLWFTSPCTRCRKTRL